MPKPKKRNFKISWIHIQAVVVIILYYVFSKAVMIRSLYSNNFLIHFLGPFLYGTISGFVFLYIFSHENFFPVAREIEKEEKKKEIKWHKRLSHHSSRFICLVVGIFAGPILTAFTIRLLIHKHDIWYKYSIIIISEIISTIFYILLAKGAINAFRW